MTGRTIVAGLTKGLRPLRVLTGWISRLSPVRSSASSARTAPGSPRWLQHADLVDVEIPNAKPFIGQIAEDLTKRASSSGTCVL
jgi:hypothetical protein